MTESSNGNCFVNFYFAKLIVGDFCFQLNAVTPSCSIDTFVLKYVTYNKNSNFEDVLVEAQCTINKRTRKLEVSSGLATMLLRDSLSA
jgi:hypothetical protein